MNILIVIDGLGVGAEGHMPGTLQSILPTISRAAFASSPTLQALVRAYTSPNTTEYTIQTGYDGADSYLGHFQMMGVPAYFKATYVNEWRDDIEAIFGRGKFTDWGYYNDTVFISNNVEAELGSTINIITDISTYQQICPKAEQLRRCTDANRLIVMTSDVVRTGDPHWVHNGVASRTSSNGHISVNGLVPAKLGMYTDTYECRHIGRGLLEYKTDLRESSYLHKCIDNRLLFSLIGKVCDIFQLPDDLSYASFKNSIRAQKVAHELHTELTTRRSDFVFANFQTFDLQCHSRDVKSAAKELITITKLIDDIIKDVKQNDLLVITADHGNNPTVKGNSHTIEDVPLITYSHDMMLPKITQLKDINALLIGKEGL